MEESLCIGVLADALDCDIELSDFQPYLFSFGLGKGMNLSILLAIS